MPCAEHNQLKHNRNAERPVVANYKRSHRAVQRSVPGVEGQTESLTEPFPAAGEPHKHDQAADGAADDAAALVPGVGPVAAHDVVAGAGAGGGDESPDQRGLLGGEAGRGGEDDILNAGEERVQPVPQAADQGPAAETERPGAADPAAGAQASPARERPREAAGAAQPAAGGAAGLRAGLPGVSEAARALQRPERLPVASVASSAAR